ncbi:MAG: AAA family ATPase, partial [Acidimicrobiia bacterium]|nr:AAA family ATPase [Acidimicrobiia bacterium]
MDHGLTRAVEAFVADVSAALQAAGVSAADAERQVVQEAYNLCMALIDVDGRHTDPELWAMVERFAPLGQLRPETTPALARENELARDKRRWLEAPSPLFEVLRDLDTARGTGAGRTYQERAIDMGYAVAALDQYPSSDEIDAITAFRRVLAEAMARPRPVPPGGPAVPQSGTTSAGMGAVPAATTQAAPGAAPAADDSPLRPPEKLEDLLAELDRLIGLQVVKDEVHRLSALLRVQKLREERGLPSVDTTNHLIFSGNPGTGKTTVARLLARIYRSLGVVAKGQYLEVDRSELVAGFVGQTATKVAEVFARADGGVLLIDEAYSLTRGGERDFGREAIDAVVKEVEDRRETMVVILAGYPREMAE